MSKEAWGDEGDDSQGFTEDRVQDIGTACFILGLQMFRETIAEYFELQLQPSAAKYVRDKWNPNWGTDPGKPSQILFDYFSARFDVWSVEP